MELLKKIVISSEYICVKGDILLNMIKIIKYTK